MKPDFVKEETRDGFFVDVRRKKLWAAQLAILEVFLDICERNRLRYFAVDGTLLGAVRHKGFIPWDDDIDVAMPRRDFERFLKLAPSHLPPHLSLHYRRNDPKVPWDFFAKIRNRNTTFICQTRSHLDIHHGIHIDIFPMDGLPKTDRAWGRFEQRRRRLQRWDRRIRSSWKDTPSLPSRIGLLPARVIKWIFGENFFHNRIERLMMESDYETADLEIHCWWIGISRGKHDRRSLDSHVLLDFEHLKLRCPAGFDAYLRECYGDYTQFPPPEKRGNWHNAVFVDCDRPYTDYYPYAQCFPDPGNAPSPPGPLTGASAASGTGPARP